MSNFKENVNMFTVSDSLKAPMIHGHTTIEFKNVKNGKRERIESDNTFMATNLTKANKMCGSIGRSLVDHRITWGTLDPIIAYCGGIFLFKDPVPAGSQFMNSTNEMVANGCHNITNTGNPLELGSWNGTESDLTQAHSAKLVWDWDTSHGNGQISSVCLTSRSGGYIGYGNPSGTAPSSSIPYGFGTDSQAIGGFYINTSYRPGDSAHIGYKTYIGDYIYWTEWASPNLTVKRRRIINETGSIFSNRYTEDVDVLNLSELLPSISTPNTIRVGNSDDKMILICNQQTVAAGGSFSYFLYNFETKEKTETITITNNGTKSFSTVYHLLYSIDEEDRDNDLLFCSYGQTTAPTVTVNILNAKTGALIDTVDSTNGPTWNISVTYPFIKDCALIHNGFVFNGKNKTLYPINCADRASDTPLDFFENGAYFLSRYGENPGTLVSDYGHSHFPNPLFLTTINNLQSSVTKDNTLTMKVTYTLNEV